ncbi:MAG TPA: DNA recombination protein RmuC [Candidatus Eisenbacteria bacterium]|nr:DNA recombination protein RmuC [Candidatus Eisenbacteria bacterium]
MIALLLTGAAAFAAGAVLAYALARSRSAASEARVQELRAQIDSDRQGFDGLRRRLQETETAKTQAETRAAETEKNLAEQKTLLEDARRQLSDAFESLAHKALASNNQSFIQLADKVFQATREGAKGDLEACRQEISATVADMKTKFDECQRLIKDFETGRIDSAAKLEGSLSRVFDAEQSIRMETSALRRALTSGSGVRGSLGEAVLVRILEDCGFKNGIHFETQLTLSGQADSDSRPDLVLKLPEGRRLAFDSKEVGGEFLLAQETDDPDRRKEHLAKLVQNIRATFNRLSRKEYHQSLDPDVPFVVMFISNESACRTALETDPSLYEEARAKKIFLASPMTVIPFLQLVSQAWQQHQLAKNAQELGQAVEVLGERLHVFTGHLKNMRDGIQKSADAWDAAVGSWERNVEPQIEKSRTLGGKLKETKELPPINARLRVTGPAKTLPDPSAAQAV